MICAFCRQQPEQQPCEYCGGNPVLVGRFDQRLDGLITKGSTGSLYRGMALVEQWPTAVRATPLSAPLNQGDVEPLTLASAALQQLSHPGIPRHFDHVVLEQGKGRTLWTTVEFVTGKSLADQMKEPGFTEERALELGLEVLGMLQTLHQHSPVIVHGNIGPNHLILRQPGNRLSLVDFSSVRRLAMGMAALTARDDMRALGKLMVALIAGREDVGPWQTAIPMQTATSELFSVLMQKSPSVDYRALRKLFKAALRAQPAVVAPRFATPEPAEATVRRSGRGKPKPRPRAGKPAVLGVNVGAEQAEKGELSNAPKRGWMVFAAVGLVGVIGIVAVGSTLAIMALCL